MFKIENNSQYDNDPLDLILLEDTSYMWFYTKKRRIIISISKLNIESAWNSYIILHIAKAYA